MKETIYTIPITTAFEETTASGGCAVCNLHGGLERDSLEYTLGAAMMEPDVRIETNRLGFCFAHYEKMLAAQKRLSLALILQSHLAELKGNPRKHLEKPGGCYICSRVGGFLEKYYSNIIYLWKTSPDFRSLYNKAPSVCLKHGEGLYGMAGRELSKKEAVLFRGELERRLIESLEVQSGGVDRFCKSFDYRYSDMELGEDKTAVERSLTFLAGGYNT